LCVDNGGRGSDSRKRSRGDRADDGRRADNSRTEKTQSDPMTMMVIMGRSLANRGNYQHSSGDCRAHNFAEHGRHSFREFPIVLMNAKVAANIVEMMA
jgi:hypothetical protein